MEALDPLSEPELDTLLACVRERRLGPGEVLYAQGQPGDSLAIVLEGVLVVHERPERGLGTELRRVVAGEMVGEMALIDPAPRSATLTALDAAVVVELDRGALDLLVERAPRVGGLLLGLVTRTAARRLRAIDEEIAEALGEEPTVPVLPPTEPNPRRPR